MISGGGRCQWPDDGQHRQRDGRLIDGGGGAIRQSILEHQRDDFAGLRPEVVLVVRLELLQRLL